MMNLILGTLCTVERFRSAPASLTRVVRQTPTRCSSRVSPTAKGNQLIQDTHNWRENSKLAETHSGAERVAQWRRHAPRRGAHEGERQRQHWNTGLSNPCGYVVSGVAIDRKSVV